MKVILITGCSTGIGLATARHLAARGDRVYATARRPDASAELVAARADLADIRTLPLDVTDDGSVHAAVKAVLDAEGRIDVLVNNAGIGAFGTFEFVPEDAARATFETNFWGVMRVTRAVLPSMRAQGSGVIVNISSFLGRMGLPLLAHYNASKYAVEGITDSLRLELSPFHIRVHTVAPGLFRTQFVARGLAANSRTTAPDSPYAPLAGHLLPVVAQRINEGPDPIAVAQAVLRVLQDPNAPARIPVGTEATSADELKRTLPPVEFEAAIRKLYGL
jgi:NAD(P)-dependent dehydrogenase (short-subunit alcohol dehydrogenase family)